MSNASNARLALSGYFRELWKQKRFLWMGAMDDATLAFLAKTAAHVTLLLPEDHPRLRRHANLRIRRVKLADGEMVLPKDIDWVVIPEIAALGNPWKDALHDLLDVLREETLLVGTPLSGGDRAPANVLKDVLKRAFKHTFMVHETPFSGFSVGLTRANTNTEEDVMVDSEFVRTVSPCQLFVVGSPKKIALDGCVIVQTPAFTAPTASEKPSRQEKRVSSKVRTEPETQANTETDPCINMDEVNMDETWGELPEDARAYFSRLQASEKRLSERVSMLSGQLMAARDLLTSSQQTQKAQPTHAQAGAESAESAESSRALQEKIDALEGECEGLRLRLTHLQHANHAHVDGRAGATEALRETKDMLKTLDGR